jgi:hypothetical protein
VVYVALSTIHRAFAAAWAVACLLSAVVVLRHLVRSIRFLILTLDLGAATQTAQLAWLVMDSWLIEALLAAFAAAIWAYVRRRRLPGWTMVVPAAVAVLVAVLLVPWPWQEPVSPDLVGFGFSPPAAQPLSPRDRTRLVVTVLLAAAPLLLLAVGGWPRRRGHPPTSGFGTVDLSHYPDGI